MSIEDANLVFTRELTPHDITHYNQILNANPNQYQIYLLFQAILQNLEPSLVSQSSLDIYNVTFEKQDFKTVLSLKARVAVSDIPITDRKKLGFYKQQARALIREKIPLAVTGIALITITASALVMIINPSSKKFIIGGVIAAISLGSLACYYRYLLQQESHYLKSLKRKLAQAFAQNFSPMQMKEGLSENTQSFVLSKQSSPQHSTRTYQLLSSLPISEDPQETNELTVQWPRLITTPWSKRSCLPEVPKKTVLKATRELNLLNLPLDILNQIFAPIIHDILFHPDPDVRKQIYQNLRSVSKSFSRCVERVSSVINEELTWRKTCSILPLDVVKLIKRIRENNNIGLSLGWLHFKQPHTLSLNSANTSPEHIAIPDFPGYESFISMDRPMVNISNTQEIQSFVNPITQTQSLFLHSLPISALNGFHVVVGLDSLERPFLAVPCEYTFTEGNQIHKFQGVGLLQRISLTNAGGRYERWIWINQVPFRKTDYGMTNYIMQNTLKAHVLMFAIYLTDSTRTSIVESESANISEKCMLLHMSWLSRLLNGERVGWLLHGYEGLSAYNRSDITIQLYKSNKI